MLTVMKITVPLCILCDSEDVALWTLNNQDLATVTYVCREHAAPLQAIMDAAGAEPPHRQRRSRPGAEPIRPLAGKTRRKAGHMEPLDWEPPSSKKVPAAGTVSAGVNVPVQFSDNAAEGGAGSDRHDMAS